MFNSQDILSFLPKHAIGLDISDNSIEALELEKKFGKLIILAYARKKLEPGLIQNGQIIDKKKLVENVKDLLSSSTPGHFKTKDVILSIPESKTYIHIFKLPTVISEENIGESVQYEAEATIPISFDEAYHDYEVVKKDENNQDVLYVTCQKKIVDDYRDVVEQAGLNPVIFEAESMSLARALIHDQSEKGTLLIDVGARTSIVTIYDSQSIHYSDNIDIGGNIFSEKIAEAMSINSDEADRIKRNIGIIKEKIKERVFANLEPITEEVVAAAKKAINYYEKSGRQVGSIILAGGGSLMPGLKEYFEDKFEINVSIGDPLKDLNRDNVLFKKYPPLLFSTVIGLAKRGVDEASVKNGINLLAHEHEHKAFQISRPHKNEKIKTEPNSEKKYKKIISKLSFGGGKFNFKPQNKRMYILLSVFIFLIITFVVILFLAKDKEEPLIQFQDYDYPSGPVEY